MATKRKRRRRGARKQGFSSPGERQMWDLAFGSDAPKGHAKREFFNEMSRMMVLSSAISLAVFCLVWFGVVGAILGFCAGAVLMGTWLTKNRYYR